MPTLVAVVAKICKFQHKISYDSACVGDRSNSVGNTEIVVCGVGQFDYAIKVCLGDSDRPSLPW